MRALVVDVGSSSVRASLVDEHGKVRTVARVACPPSRPSPGVVELDAQALADAILDVARAGCAAAAREQHRVEVVAVAAQRASSVLWERATGRPVGPAIGWQDLRTTGRCMQLHALGHRLTPSQSATKLAYLLDTYDRQRQEDLCFGTIETWAAWTLSGGRLHVSDATNAAVSGLVRADASGYDPAILEALNIDESVLARLVDTTGIVGEASALDGAPPIGALVGDQQASLVGQGCLRPGAAKLTAGTGAMLDCSTGSERPSFSARGDAGTFPIVTRQEHGQRFWGVEAIALSAGACVDWLCSGLELLARVEDSDALAASVTDAGGVSFVPALGGIGTPLWDFGARATFVGIDGSTTRAQIVRAVLEGIAQRCADLLEAVEADTGLSVPVLKMDGGMSTNESFVQLVADATGRPVELAGEVEATTAGAALLGGLAIGAFSSLEEATTLLGSRGTVEPSRRLDRSRWLLARERATKTVPFLSALEF